MQADPRFGRLLAALAALAALAGCDARSSRTPAGEAASPSRPVAEATVKVKRAPPARRTSNAPTPTTLDGVWRVIRVSEPTNAPAADHTLGAILDLHPEALRWSYTPAGAPGMEDICTKPTLAPLSGNEAARSLGDLFLKATGKPSILYGWNCEEGHWGEGAVGSSELALIGSDEIAMRWYGDAILILRRLPGSHAVMTRPSDAGHLADDYR